MIEERHSIESFRFSISTPDDISPHEMQNSVSNIFKHYIHPELSKLFTECAGDQFIQIDTIEIDLGSLEYENLAEELPQLVFQELKKQLSLSLTYQPDNKKQPIDSNLKALVYLLEHGAIPWWAPQLSNQTINNLLLTVIEKSSKQLVKFLDTNFHKVSIHTRFVHNTSTEVNSKISEFIQSQNIEISSPQFLSYIEEKNSIESQVLYLLNTISEHNPLSISELNKTPQNYSLKYLRKELSADLFEQLKNSISSVENNFSSNDILDIAIHFLKNGSAPWWLLNNETQSLNSWLSKALEVKSEYLIQYLIKNFNNYRIRNRFIKNNSKSLNSRITKLVIKSGLVRDDSLFVEYLREHHLQYFSPNLHTLVEQLKQPSQIASLSQLQQLFLEAEKNNSQKEVRLHLINILSDTHNRRQAIKYFPEHILDFITEYLAPNASSCVEQIHIVIELATLFFQKATDLAQDIRNRIWDLGINYLLNSSLSSSLTSTILSIIYSERDELKKGFISFSQQFINQERRNFQTEIKHQVVQWTEKLLAASELKNPPSVIATVDHHIEQNLNTHHLNISGLSKLKTSDSSKLRPRIQKLFKELIQRKSSINEQIHNEILTQLHKESHLHLSKTYLSPVNLSSIIDLSLNLQLQILSTIHPNITQQHKNILIRVWPLKHLKTSNSVYREFVAYLIKEKNLITIKSDSGLRQVLQTITNKLNIPKENQHLILSAILPNISSTQIASLSSSTPELRPIEKLTNILTEQNFNANQNTYTSLINEIIKNESPDNFKNLLINQLKTEQRVITFLSRISPTVISTLIHFLNKLVHFNYPNLIDELYKFFCHVLRSNNINRTETVTYLQRDGILSILIDDQADPENCVQKLFTSFSKKHSITSDQIKQQISPLDHPLLTDLLFNKSVQTPQHFMNYKEDTERLNSPVSQGEDIITRDANKKSTKEYEPIPVLAMPRLWSQMLEKLWRNDQVSVIRQLAQVALSGDHATEHYQSVSPNLLKAVLETLFPELVSSIHALQDDVENLHFHQLLPGLQHDQNLYSIITPSLLTTLNSTHVIKTSLPHIAQTLFQALATQQNTSLKDYLKLLISNLDKMSESWLKSSCLPSIIFHLTKSSSNIAGLNTEIDLAYKTLIKGLKVLIKQVDDSKSTQDDILQHCLSIISLSRETFLSPLQIVSTALYELKIAPPKQHLLEVEQARIKKSAPHKTNIQSLFDPNITIPAEANLLHSINLIARETPLLLLIPLSKNLKQVSFIESFNKRSTKIKSRLLEILSPQYAIFIKVLISRILSSLGHITESSLWAKALHSISEIQTSPKPNELTYLVSHFLNLNGSPQEQAKNLLKIQPQRLTAGHSKLNVTLYEISNNISSTEINRGLTDYQQQTSMAFIQDITDTLIAISIDRNESIDHNKFIYPLLKHTSQLQELVTQFFINLSTQLKVPLPELCQNHWSLIQELSSTYRDSRTLPVFYQVITTLLPIKEIPLPLLPEGNQTIFESSSPSSTNTDQIEIYTIEQSSDQKLKLVTDLEHEVWLIENAGLVLFTPYLQMLLERSGLVQNGQFTNPDKEIEGVFLLHYLVYETTEAEEHQLLLNRILCNIPLDTILPKSIEPNTELSELCEGLITAIIQHWSSLGNTTSEGLMNTFIRRKGSLCYDVNEGWSLHIPTEAYDMLLQTLPWAVSSIHLPWMLEPIRIDWKSIS